MERYIFLDIDGVLNNRRTHILRTCNVPGISMSNLKILKEIVDRTGGKPVLISDWRMSFHEQDHMRKMARYITDKLNSIGLTFELVSNEYSYSDRAIDIRNWLETHPADGYIILDDLEFKGYLHPSVAKHWIRPDSEKGLVPEHIDQAVQKMLLPVEPIPCQQERK